MAIPFYNEEQENEVEHTEGESEKSLLKQLVKVFVDFCEKVSSGGSKNKSSWREPHSRRRRNSRRELQQNDLSLQKMSLPDIVSSHIPEVYHQQSHIYYWDHSTRQTPLSSILDDEPCSSSIKTSLTYCTHQRIGKSLRNIADQFEKNRSNNPCQHNHRRRHYAGSRHECNCESTIKFAFQIVIQITMIGLDFALSWSSR